MNYRFSACMVVQYFSTNFLLLWGWDCRLASDRVGVQVDLRLAYIAVKSQTTKAKWSSLIQNLTEWISVTPCEK